eukprot:1834891-Pyramimonas_sp.AAC.1
MYTVTPPMPMVLFQVEFSDIRRVFRILQSASGSLRISQGPPGSKGFLRHPECFRILEDP